MRSDRRPQALLLPEVEILNQHQITAGFVVLIKEDITGIWRNADPAVERPPCDNDRVVLAGGEAEESNESLLACVRGRPVIYMPSEVTVNPTGKRCVGPVTFTGWPLWTGMLQISPGSWNR